MEARKIASGGFQRPIHTIESFIKLLNYRGKDNMKKEQEARLKHFFISDLEIILSKDELEERKNTFKSINEVMSHLLNNEEMSNADYVD